MPPVGKRLIDAVPATPRTREMELLCFGLSRTGTYSMYTALNKLGIKSYHCGEIYFTAPGTYDLWNEALCAKLHGDGDKYGKDEFDKLLGNYGAITDIPCILFAEELMEYYPDAKVLITIRDEDSWLRSVKGLFNTLLGWNWTYIASHDKIIMEPYITLITLVWNHWTGGDWYNSDERLRQVYRNHYAFIRSKVPPEKLLEFHPKQGWEPLCKHIGINDIPEESYPHVNELAFSISLFRRFWWITAIKAAARTSFMAAVPVAVIFAAWYWRK